MTEVPPMQSATAATEQALAAITRWTPSTKAMLAPLPEHALEAIADIRLDDELASSKHCIGVSRKDRA